MDHGGCKAMACRVATSSAHDKKWRSTSGAVSTIYNPVTGWVADSINPATISGNKLIVDELDVVTITTNIDVLPLLGLVVELRRNGVTLASATWPGDAVRSVKTLTWTGAVAPDDEIYLVANPSGTSVSFTLHNTTTWVDLAPVVPAVCLKE